MTASAWGAGALALLVASWWTTEHRSGGDLLAAVSNGLLIFFLVGGVGIAEAFRERARAKGLSPTGAGPWSVAVVPAAATFVTVGGLRLVALALDVSGPWSDPLESGFDVGFRSAVVFAVVAVVAHRR